MIKYDFLELNKFLYEYKIEFSVGMLTILFLIIVLLFSFFTNRGWKKNIQERKEKFKIAVKGIEQIMSMSDDTFFGLDVLSGVIIFSENMEQRFGWHFPSKLSKSDREDVSRIWQIYEEDVDILKKMFTDVCHDAKTVKEELRILNINRDYVKYEVKFCPVMDRKNNVIFIIGNIKHD